LPFDVGPHIGRRHQSHGMAERLELARPVMRRCAGLNPNDARRQLLEERQDIAAFELAADDHITVRVDAVDLKDRLRDIETDRHNAEWCRCGRASPRSGGSRRAIPALHSRERSMNDKEGPSSEIPSYGRLLPTRTSLQLSWPRSKPDQRWCDPG